MFLKNKNIVFKIRRSKVTDNTALRQVLLFTVYFKTLSAKLSELHFKGKT